MVINGEKLSKEKLRKLKAKIKKSNLNLQLDILYIGKSKASDIFIKKKEEAANDLGIKVNIHHFKKNVSPEIIKATCNNLNANPNCTGYFMQLPISKELAEENILDFISEYKDVDGLTSTSLGKVCKGLKDSIRPATVEAIITILRTTKMNLRSKVITIVNDSNLIGKPLSSYLLTQGATVNICNEFTKNLKSFTQSSDVVVTATGKAKLIKEDFVKKGVILIDAGISTSKGKTVGDVDFKTVSRKAKVITPVPKGVGPLTVVCLMENLLKLYEGSKA